MQSATALSSPRSQSSTALDSLLHQSDLDSASSVGEVGDEGVVLKGVTDEQQFIEKRDTLVEAIDHTNQLLSNLQEFEEGGWTVRYPSELGVQPPQAGGSLPCTPVRRATTLEPGAVTELRRPEHNRTASEAPAGHETPAKGAAGAHPLSILSLDLRLERQGSAPSLPALLPTLSAATLSQLLSRRIASSRSHLGVLRARVLDRSSRILVTGDVNSGKSTFVNALLRRPVMPVDQQPCTEVFAEVLDAHRCNNGVEEVHAIRAGELDGYDPTDASTFERFSLEQLDKVVQLEEPASEGETPESPYQMVRLYLNDVEAADAEPGTSLVRNGLVDIALIDAPGLNRDTLSTTALFARQSEIDVIVFVVSAENHFTLSAKEFLWNASREKAYVFVVVNKWGGIRDKARCRRLVGEQIRQLSPATWEARDELVHYVESAEVVVEALRAAQAEHEAEGGETVVAPEFAHLEDSLKSFVLLKRSQSKLAPAKHYLLNLLADLSVLADANLDAAETELEAANVTLERVRPEHERLSRARDEIEDGIVSVEDGTVDGVRDAAAARLERAVAQVAEGRVASARPGEAVDSTFKAPTALPDYPGVLGLWSWAGDVKDALVRSLDGEVRGAEENARTKTTAGVCDIMVDLGNAHLPVADRKNERVFRPEVMFARRRKGVEGALAAARTNQPGTTGLGLSLGATWAAQDVDVSILDLVDLEKIFRWGRSVTDGRSVSDKVADEAGTLSVVSLGVGAITMFGSRAVGVRGLVEALARACEVLGSKQARKWVGPVVGVATLGLAVYIIIDLPHAVPRNIGRKLQTSLAAGPNSLEADEPLAITDGTSRSFASAHSERIAKESRKVLRLAGWDLRERYRAAFEKSAAERSAVEETKQQAEAAIDWLTDFIRRTEENEATVEGVDLSSGTI